MQEHNRNLKARNKVLLKDYWEVIKYTFSLRLIKELILKYGYFIHDHVAPRAQMNIAGNPRIHPSASLRCGYNITLGNNSHINQFCCVWASENAKIVIGSNVLMGPSAKLFSSNHNVEKLDVPMNSLPLVEKDIFIGDNVWIGANAVIVAGVKIGNNSIVAAGSVVTKEVPENVIVAGAPAKTVKSR
jgi:acetyltransferase-like isoleucine patch superfamily enzyme